MTKLIPVLLLTCFLGCSKDNDQKEYTTIIGNVYIAKDRKLTEHRTLYLIYEFLSNDSIKVVERWDSEDGEIYDQSMGYFEYSHPELKLKVRSIKGCDDCFNYFTAAVNDDRKSFMYQIWDVTINNHRDLIFNVRQ